MTGMRRNEVLGLKWPDVDFARKRLHLNRGLIAVGYEVQQTRGKTKTRARRAIALDNTTLGVLAGWRAHQAAEFAAVGIANAEQWVFTDGSGEPVHPHAVYDSFRRIVHKAGVPRVRFHDLRHTHGSLLIKDGVHVKVVSERLGHANIGSRCRPINTFSRACKPTPLTQSNVSPRQYPRTKTHRGNTGRTAGGRAPEPGEHPPTSKAQVADLGLHSQNGGGGRI